MAFLDRNQYNKKIKELNISENILNSAQKLLQDKDKDFSNKLSDYEEIVLLVNTCIAYDINSNSDELYKYYLKIMQMLDGNSSIGLKDSYNIYYCMGVFSFKFHDYKRANEYFEKSKKQMYLRETDPLVSEELRHIYIRLVILISYAKEYSSIGYGAIDAINNLLDNNMLSTELEVSKIVASKPKEVVNYFFQENKSKVYNKADEAMKKEIVHVLSHCFSEYSVFLRKEKSEPKDIFMWENLAEKFILSLGSEMVTCQAIIQAEHGHYWQALETMKECYKELIDDAENDVRKVKAELAFYIYYFSNQIGLDNNKDVLDCKKYFIEYAKSVESRDTKIYAWIVDFREDFAKALKLSPRESIAKLIELEQKCMMIDEYNQNQSYIHPQILEEKKRLLLAYQIVRSFLHINNQEIDYSYNNLFEKCILFNSINKPQNKDFSNEEPVEPDKNGNVSIEFQGVNLCIRGMTDDICKKLEREFCTEISYIHKKITDKQEVVICDNEQKYEEFMNSIDDNVTYFVYCGDEKINKLNKIEEENINLSHDLLKTIMMAYIQETLENCFICANRWDEFFIMAPITDNKTFSFQNQSIDKYIELAEDNLEEKRLFLADCGYVISNLGELSGINEIDFVINANDIEKCRLYYYCNQWLYTYNHDKKCMIPFKLFDSTEIIEANLESLQGHSRRIYKKQKNCNCNLDLPQNRCLCDEINLEDNKKKSIILDLLMTMSIELPNLEEKYCTIVFSNKVQRGQPLGSIFILLSNKTVMNASLRTALDELNSVHKSGNKKSSTQTYVLDSDGFEDRKELDKKKKELIAQIKEYLEKNDRYFSSSVSEQRKKIMDLLDRIKSSDANTTYNEFYEEWNNLSQRSV